MQASVLWKASRQRRHRPCAQRAPVAVTLMCAGQGVVYLCATRQGAPCTLSTGTPTPAVVAALIILLCVCVWKGGGQG